jgi:hypothetical protein
VGECITASIPQNRSIRNVEYPETMPHMLRPPKTPSHACSFVYVAPQVVRAASVGGCRSLMPQAFLFGGALGLLRFGCATYQHRPQITGVHNACCVQAQGSKQQ